MERSNFDHHKKRWSNLDHRVFERSNFDHRLFLWSNFDHHIFRWSKLDHSKFRWSKLDHLFFWWSKFDHTKFRWSNLDHSTKISSFYEIFEGVKSIPQYFMFLFPNPRPKKFLVFWRRNVLGWRIFNLVKAKKGKIRMVTILKVCTWTC